jgi:hypothetical protein
MKATLATLRSTFIVTRNSYSDYTRADHDMALAFRVIASAHIEEYAEERCKEIARKGIAELQNGRRTRAGCVLLTWFLANGNGKRGDIPLGPTEVPTGPLTADALNAFLSNIESSHGVSGQKLRTMTFRIGLEQANLDERLIDTLTTLAEDRGKAAHTRVKRAKTMAEPKVEWETVDGLLALLEAFDDELNNLLATV